MARIIAKRLISKKHYKIIKSHNTTQDFLAFFDFEGTVQHKPYQNPKNLIGWIEDKQKYYKDEKYKYMKKMYASSERVVDFLKTVESIDNTLIIDVID